MLHKYDVGHRDPGARIWKMQLYKDKDIEPASFSQFTLNSASDISIAEPRVSRGMLIALDAPSVFKLPSR